MSVEPTPMELLTKALNMMEDKRKSMEASVKASEARLKDIRSQYDVAAIKVNQELTTLEIEYEQKRVALVESIGPLQGQVDALRHQVEKEQQKLAAVDAERQTILEERRAQVALLDAALKTKQEALASVSSELTALKEKVAAL